jgi:hypothetical protein
MDIKLNLSVTSIKNLFVQTLRRFHIVLFVIVVFGGLAVVILMLNSIITKSSDSAGYTSETNNAAFDQTTIQRIQQLKTADQNNGDLDLSHGRSNPFVE